MDIELRQIRDFLAEHPPFQDLPDAVLDRLPRGLSVRYLLAGTPFPPAEEQDTCLYVLRRGAVELRDAAGQLVDKLGEGDCFASACGDSVEGAWAATTAEDCLVYQLPCTATRELCERHPDLAHFLTASAARRLRNAVHTQYAPAHSPTLMRITLGELVRRAPVTVPPDMPIAEVARHMTASGVSSVVVLSEDAIQGLVTDRDLRARCLAAGVPPETSVADIMSRGVHTARHDALGFEGFVEMTRRNIHHLPVTAGERLAGVVTLGDLMRHEAANAVFLVAEIEKARTGTELVELSRQIRAVQIHLVKSGASAQIVGQAISAVGEALTRRWLTLAEAELGPPPLPYAWLAGGSLARREQTSHSDQDNALLLADTPSPDDAPYFATLAQRVCDGLNACGYVYCPGEVMATNPQWRQPVSVWRRYFHDWITRPEPKALMLASVFFDLRVIHGEAALFDALHGQVLHQTQGNSIFLAYLTANALQHRPPLGFFRSFVLVHDGKHDDTVDLKHRGVVPVVDLARIYALAAGLPEVNTWERLTGAAAKGDLSEEGRSNLADALEFIATLRLQHQVRQLEAGREADNFVAPDQLSRLERGHLKDAFKVIATLQAALGNRYQAARFY